MTLSKTTLRWFIGIAGVAILALMVYSIDRTAWVFGLFEGGRDGAWMFGLAAAIVIELAGIAFIIAEATAVKQIRFWVVLGLAAILIVQTLANLIAGALRGYDTIAGALPTNDWATAWALALWAFANALIPALIFILSKIEAYLVRYYLLQSTPVSQSAAQGVASLSQPVAPVSHAAPEPAQPVAPATPEPVAPAHDPDEKFARPQPRPVAPTFVLDDLLRSAGLGRDTARETLTRYGLADDADRAYSALNRFGKLPRGMTLADFRPLFAELMDDAPTPAAPLTQDEPTHDAPAFVVPAAQYDDYMTIVDALTSGRASLRTVAAQLGTSDASARRRRDALVKAGVLTRDGDAYQKNGVALVKGE
jgi:hypothetical protein